MHIIKSMLQNDFYKFPMAQVVLHQCQGTWVKYKFKCRNGSGLPMNVDDTEGIEKFMKILNIEIDNLCTLRFTTEELIYLRTYPFLSEDFIDYLSLVKLDRKHIKCYVEDGKLCVEIEGPWIRTIWFECMVLAIISELYHEFQLINGFISANLITEGRKRLHNNIKLINDYKNTEEGSTFTIADFGFRRAYSTEWHEIVLREMLEHTKC